MKISRFLLTPAIALLGLLSPLRADDAALERFKGEMQELKTYSEEQEKTIKPEDPAAGVRVVRNIVAKLRKVGTAGLPDDLKGAYEEFVGVMSKMEKVFEGWPDTAAEFTTYVQKKAQEDPKFLENLGPSVAAVEKEMQPVMQKFDTLGKKYGIENLNSLSPK